MANTTWFLPFFGFIHDIIGTLDESFNRVIVTQDAHAQALILDLIATC
jgi:hypothetical protein